MPDVPLEPYGGVLVSPLINPARVSDRLRALDAAPSWGVTPAQLVDLELLLTGAFSPLRGFMNAEQAEASRLHGRLPDGTVWPASIVLAIAEEIAQALGPRTPLVLRDLEGAPLAVLAVDEVWRDAAAEGSPWRAAGLLEGLRLPLHRDFTPLRSTVAATRGMLAVRGWTRTIALPLSGPLTPALIAEVQDSAARLDAGVLVIGLLEPAGLDQTDHFPGVRELQAGFDAFPADRAALMLLPWNRIEPIDRDRALRAIVARNLGCTHVVQPGTADARLATDIGLTPVSVSAPFEEAIRAGLDPPAQRGVTIFFTGLSGSGKSTIANLLRVRLLEHGRRRVTLLDGDLVRRHLSSELGFSREHRELNVRRIAYVASEITRHGGTVICAPIAPYETGRREARRLVEAVGDFVLVFVDAPLEACERRDPKGLYAKARAGLIPAFTGVSDPYERPANAEIVLDTTTLDPHTAADRVMAWLTARGYLG